MRERSIVLSPERKPSSGPLLIVLPAVGLSLALNIAGLTLFLVNSITFGDSTEWYVTNLVGRVSAFVLPLTGAVIAYKRPHNLVGWSIIGVGLLFGVATFALEYSGLALDRRIASGIWGNWFFSWVSAIGYGWLATFPLYFPTGHLLSHRWRPVLALAIVSASCMALSLALRDGPLTSGYWFGVLNPAGVPAFDAWIDELRVIGQGLVAISVGLGIGSLAVRFGRARGEEREQIKWVALAVMAVIFTYSLSLRSSEAWEPWTFLLFALALMLLPISMAIAILKYHLYDIDRWINRTLVYLILTAVLVTTYFALVVVLQSLTQELTGSSSIVIVITTLVVAALFLPARMKIQTSVDRHFYRQQFDAQRTVEAFAARLREQVDLQTLQEDLTGVIDETVKPSATLIWLAKRIE